MTSLLSLLVRNWTMKCSSIYCSMEMLSRKRIALGSCIGFPWVAGQMVVLY